MSHTMMTVYFVSVLVMWVPLAFAVRRAFRGTVTDILVGGLMAVVWPFALPVLSSITLSRRERRLAQLVPGASLQPATIRPNTGTNASRSPGWSSAVSGSKHPRRRSRSPIIAPAENAMPRTAFTAK